jgi:sulfatase modifying factor 1
MTMPLARLGCLLSLLLASSAPAVTMDWTPIGNPANACDQQSQGCFGSVGYSYSIGTYEVTNAQYAEFLNAKAKSDPLGLYSTNMGVAGSGGIARSGQSGSYTYSTVAGWADRPVNFVSFYDSVRFANWLNNGQGSGDTETGAYTLLGGTAEPSNGTTVTRNLGATIVLPSEDEWYKAAYYSPSGVYFDYPTGNDTQPLCTAPTATPNRANCGFIPAHLTDRGSYTGSASPYGTFDQGGNVAEWNETIIGGSGRGLRGGTYQNSPSDLASSVRYSPGAASETPGWGFRLVMIPEPSTNLLVIAGLLGLAAYRRQRA